jgi:hypothetical protein
MRPRRTPCLIVTSTHGRSGLDRWLLGSITDRVIRHTQQPLLLLPLGEDERIGTTNLEAVILTLDGSALAEQVLPHVPTLARDLPLRVVPLWVGSRHTQSSHPPQGPVAPRRRAYPRHRGTDIWKSVSTPTSKRLLLAWVRWR